MAKTRKKKPNKTPPKRYYFELPELSERFGCFVTSDTFEGAQAIADAHGVDVIWRVTSPPGIPVPLYAGVIWQKTLAGWRIVPPHEGVCQCPTCSPLANRQGSSIH